MMYNFIIMGIFAIIVILKFYIIIFFYILFLNFQKNLMAKNGKMVIFNGK